jgi:hypothetical protein
VVTHSFKLLVIAVPRVSFTFGSNLKILSSVIFCTGVALFASSCSLGNKEIESPSWDQVKAAFHDVAWEFPIVGKPLHLMSLESFKDNEKIIVVQLTKPELDSWLSSLGVKMSELKTRKVERKNIFLNRPKWFQLEVGEVVSMPVVNSSLSSRANQKDYPWYPLSSWVKQLSESEYKFGLLLHQYYDSK